MKTFVAVASLMVAGSAWAAGPRNLASPTYRVVEHSAPKELTRKDVNKLIARAETAADHLKIAAYYRGDAHRLDAQGAAYENASNTYRNGPAVKNLLAPSTTGRFDFIAKGFRDEALAAAKMASSHEVMAKEAAGL